MRVKLTGLGFGRYCVSAPAGSVVISSIAPPDVGRRRSLSAVRYAATVDTTPRTLSSAQTFLMKVIFPPFWIGGFALATITLFLSPGSWHDARGGALDPDTTWFLLFATLVAGGFICWSG